ncbi:GGDEF domain-containing protein [Pseudarthrobacter sp. NBSH8]|nr:GGDEF domain-containing protein [Pseudarthrobacter sp. NBSH8]QNE14457.1 GGDEF domain-containing protein [Pseudarthrobacter sp. NBSH8]
MVLDTATLRVAFAIVAVVLVVLFLGGFLRTRSSYSGWWCIALMNFLTGSLLFLLNGTAHQPWANPLGNTLLVLGSASVWAGARSLLGRRLGIPLLIVAPAVTAAASVLDQRPDTWSGGLVFLAMMSLMIAMASRDMWRPGQEPVIERRTLAIAAALFAAYYAARCLVFALQGPHSQLFETYFGSAVTTIATLVLMVIVSHSMTALSNVQLITTLHHLASRDALTGLLNKGAFLELATTELGRLSQTGSPAVLIMADLDDFKAVNDNHGHLAGDQILRDFAAACSNALRKEDLIGRFGGEEFILLLPGASESKALEAISRINNGMLRSQKNTAPQPTASYGIAPIPNAAPQNLNELIQAADAALYEAKFRGRNQAVAASTIKPQQ